jgi:hypothetical protein
MATYEKVVDVPDSAERTTGIPVAEPFSPQAERPLLYDNSSSRQPLLGGLSPGDVPALPSAHLLQAINSSDVQWGSQVLDTLEHPSVLMAGLVVVIIIALQDVSLLVGLVTASVLTVLDLLCTLVWRVQRKLRHWPYALTHCFMWPLITWTILTLFFQQSQYHLWLNVFLWGSVATLMSMTVLYGYPFTRDLMKEKSPQGLWDEPWWTDLAHSLANIWIIIFSAMCALSLIPTLVNRMAGRQMDHALNVVFNYLAPLFLAAVGLSATRAMQDKARVRWLLAPGATATVGAGAAVLGAGSSAATGSAVGGYEPLAGGAV